MAVTDSSQRIHKLSTALANQIAAGEVIERPASVVKELLENSLDAGATDIKLTIRKGGRSLIEIQDNGCGIHPDDLSLALAQHATSKLSQQSDLEKIGTLGFRGEALSSIASVSRFQLSSRIADQEYGWSIDALALQQTPVGMSVGTHVQVRDLFFNTPARRKFLRTDNTEFFHIREIVRRVALSRHDVSFHLNHNDKSILQCSGIHSELKASIAERVQAILGQAFLANAYEIDSERNGLRMWGWFGHPQFARNQLDQQYFYLNGRVIRDKQVNHALRMATQGHLYPGKHAVYVLFLEMEPSQVDVNVHPAKHEVRFRQARDVHDFIFTVLNQTFARHAKTLESANSSGDMREWSRDDFLSDNLQNQNIQEEGARYSFSQNNGMGKEKRNGKRFVDNYRHQININSRNQHDDTLSSSADSVLIENRYLIMQKESQTLLLDIPLCRETIALSKLENDFASANEIQGIRRRPLLVPLMMNVAVEEADLVEDRQTDFENFGLKIDRLAEDSLFIREVPLHLEYADITLLIKDLLPLIKAGNPDAEILKIMAGHANDAGFMQVNTETATQLIAELGRVESGAAVKLKPRAWRKLDGEMLTDLLKRSV